jgi:glycosyltransferase involved in cell wall biosynthesis
VALTGLPRIEAQANRLLMNQLPFATRSRTGRVYSVHTVDERFRGLFGTAPVWTPISASSRRMLHEEEAGVAVHASDWTPPLQRAFGQYAPRTSWRGDPPVIGRHSRDHWMKWPATKAAMKAAYCADTGYPVRILGGCTRGPLRPRDIPRNWNVSGFDAVGVEDFLRSIDVFVHFPHEDYIEEFGRNIMEAMAIGVPCILPHQFRENFGDAATYARASEVEATVRLLMVDRDRYAEMSRRGLAFVRRTSGPDRVEERMRRAWRDAVA